MADVRAAAYLIERPIRIVDEKGNIEHVMGAKKPGDPIFLRVIRDTKGGLSHMEPLNLTTAQKEQYKGLYHTKNDCMFNALFVNLSKEKQELFRDVQGMRVATAQHIKANPKIYNDLYIYQEKLRQIAPAEVPRVGFFPVIPVVQASLAAWTLYHLCQTGRAIVNDPKVQESWEERKYINTLIYSAGYLPVVGDGIHFSDALKVGNYRDAGLHAANALVTLYGGRFIGQGGRWLSNRVRSKFGNVVGQWRGGRWLAKRGGVRVKKRTNLVYNAGKQAKSWLGEDYKVVTNKAGDSIFMSKDGLRKIRFDMKNPHGDKPHMHLQEFINGKWRDAIPGTHRIYPKQ